MDFQKAILIVNTKLKELKPEKFSSSWLFEHAPYACIYLRTHCRTETDDVDWDRITSSLDRRFQKRWLRYKCKNVKPYQRQDEVDAILKRVEDKLYLMISPCDEKERSLQHRTIIALVRLGQKGNVLAQEEVVKWVTFITDEWLDKYGQLRRWKGYESEIPDKIRVCIRLYRYTGSFIGYLFRTLEYSALAKPPLVSLDDTMLDGKHRRHEYVTMQESWEMYH